MNKLLQVKYCLHMSLFVYSSVFIPHQDVFYRDEARHVQSQSQPLLLGLASDVSDLWKLEGRRKTAGISGLHLTVAQTSSQ